MQNKYRRAFQGGLLIIAIASATTIRAQYSGPESVEYDPVGDRYFQSVGPRRYGVGLQPGAEQCPIRIGDHG